MEPLSELIAAHPFSIGMNPAHVETLARFATHERFGLGQRIFHETYEADRFYLVHTGRVALQVFVPGQGEYTIQTIGAGEALGWSWLYPPYRWHFSATAVDPAEVIAFDARQLRAAMEETPAFGYAMAMRVGQLTFDRLQATRLRLLEVYDVPR
jgi:CRP-like cAMP-binding protein